MRTVATLGFALVFAALPRSGSAQPAAPAPAQSARHLDAHADRVILVPTAETHPQGTLFATVYELVIPSIGYALTDRMQASVTGFTDFESGGFFEVNLKANLLRSRWLRVAVATSGDYIRGEDDGDLMFGRVGGTAQICFELACRSSLSLHAMALLHTELATILPIGLGAAFTAQMTRVLSVLIEYSALVNAAREFEFIDLPLYLVGYGLRLSIRPSWSLELSFLRSMQSDDEIRVGPADVFEVVGVPFLAFSYRVQL